MWGQAEQSEKIYLTVEKRRDKMLLLASKRKSWEHGIEENEGKTHGVATESFSDEHMFK